MPVSARLVSRHRARRGLMTVPRSSGSRSRPCRATQISTIVEFSDGRMHTAKFPSFDAEFGVRLVFVACKIVVHPRPGSTNGEPHSCQVSASPHLCFC